MKRPRSALAALSVALVLAQLGSALAQPATGSAPTAAPGSAAPAVQRDADGITLAVDGGWLKLQVRADNIVRVAFTREGATSPENTANAPLAASEKAVAVQAFFSRESLMMVDQPGNGNSWTVDTTDAAVTLKTAQLQIRADRRSGAVTFLNATGQVITAERTGSRMLERALVQGQATHHVAQQWEPAADESLYGLGQHQLGVVDIKNYDLDLWQHNGTVVVPFLVSSRGYGILWDNNSYSRFGNLRPFAALPVEVLADTAGQAGAVTATYFGDASFAQPLFHHRVEDIGVMLPTGETLPNHAIHPGLPAEGPIGVRWEGTFAAPTRGTYAFQVTYNNGMRLWIDDRLVLDGWFQNWLPYAKIARVALETGRHKIRAEWSRDANGNTFQVRWKTPEPERPTTLWSEVGDGVDYTFVYGPKLDQVLAGYRTLTGRASLLPEWTLGLWQSRQRYETAQQSLDVVAEFRKRQIPFDNIVQDWFYWRKAEWGSHQFDPQRFPDPQAWVNAIHDQYHAHVMISVWGKFYPGTANYDEMHKRGYLYEPLLWEGIQDWVGFPYTDYDAFNADARKLFWSQVNTALFTKKIDAWWMDATEPDISSPPDLDKQKLRMNRTAMGPGGRVLNAYALMNSRGVYEGQRATAADQRVFILTRSGFAGLQRYASATWSGDMPCTWESMRRQIAAGLGYSISGVPYWSMDIGGFTAPPRFLGAKLAPEALDEWCELNARWFEFGTFVPLVRLHGESQLREPWAFGGDHHPAFRTIVKYDELRYRLLPYIYSLAGAVTQDGTTFMRPLVMDFPADASARESADEYLFGPALLVAPVTEYKARARTVYLPAAAGGWYNFWTGAHAGGGNTGEVAAPYDQMPVFVRAGAIVPFGPALQYTAEKKADPVTLVVYAGADGSFSLYEDDGLTYGYERGAFARIPLQWNERSRTLTIGDRTGTFPGMLNERTFNVVLVTPDHPLGYAPDLPAAHTVKYAGAAVEVRL